MMQRDEIKNLIKEAHQEAHECNATAEVHDWIDWFEKKLKKKLIIGYRKIQEVADLSA